MAENKFILKFSGDTTQLQGAVAQANNTLTGFVNKVKGMGGMIAAGFAVSQIGEFVLDVSKLAGEAEGVRAAFDKLPASTQLMIDLKDATKGTVSELDLMKRSVMAANFGISLKALPQLLEFASVRAKQTGQSVDYLVDSIVTGIGRKSKLILDNLGISAVQLGEAMNGVSMEAATVGEVAEAVGKIASENLKSMGEMSENASTKLERLSANWTNLKVAIGEASNSTGVLGKVTDELNMVLESMAKGNNLTWYQNALALATGPAGWLEAAKLNLAKATEEETKAQEKANKINELATVYLKDLGLDYNALMNVAGDNVDVLEIWAEMQKIAAPAVQQTTEEVEKQTESVEQLTKRLYEQAEAERMARIAKLERSLQAPKTDVLDTQQIGGVQNFDTKAVQAMNEAMAGLKLRNDEYNMSLLSQRDALIENTMAFSEMLGSIIGGSQSIGQAMAQMAAMVVESVGRMIMAQMIQKAIQDKATDFNFFAKLAIIGTAVATASSLLRKIGKSGGGGGGIGGGGGGYGGGGSMGNRYESLGQRIVLDVGFTGDAGKVLKAQIIKQDRIDSRTRA